MGRRSEKPCKRAKWALTKPVLKVGFSFFDELLPCWSVEAALKQRYALSVAITEHLTID